MSNPLVSIITPAYNSEKYIGEAIESVLKQTYGDWELIVVDDGSTDRTAEIIKDYVSRDSRIIYVYQTNQRMASARNAGIKRATGKYVAFLDADNLLAEDKLETQVAHLENDASCGVSYAKILHFFDSELEVFYENKNEKSLCSDDQLRDFLWRNPLNVLAVLIRKEYFDKYGAFQQGWRACDEHYVWINLALHDVKFCYLDKVSGFARLHKGGDSRRRDHIIDTANLFLKVLDIVEGSLSPEKLMEYKEDIKRIRRSWKIKRVIGILLNNKITSPILLPLYLARREKHYVKIKD